MGKADIDMNTIMIVAGESSGELYGSLLARALKSKWTDLHIIGVGGERMNKAGVELISSTSDAFGLVEAVSAYRKVKAVFKKAVDAIRKFMPDVLILIDYPDFNIRLAKIAKRLGIKILYYVSPQVWAWRKGRVKKIAGIVDRMAVILPFEEKIYREAGLKCEFVGHPILEEIESILDSEVKNLPPPRPPLVNNPPIPPLAKGGKGGFKTTLGLDSDKPLLSLLPGSRPHELNRLLPLMLDIVRQFKGDPEINSGKNYQFCIPLAPNTDESRYGLYLEALKQEGVIIKKGESVRVLAASDMAVVASGTATLQTAFLEVPMVVIYKLSLLTYLLGKLILDVKYISLVNILSGRGVVTELLQERANPEYIIKELKKIMFDMNYREGMLNHYRLIKKLFSGKRASKRVAEMVMEMAGRRE
jgi:lipid-A-disaccharide synthase